MLDPNINSVVCKEGGFVVYIVSGFYLDPNFGRISNSWAWRSVLKNGELGDLECGYGNFFALPDGVYVEKEVRIAIKKTKQYR